MPTMTQTGAQYILSEYFLQIIDFEEFSIEVLRIVTNMIASKETPETIHVFTQETLWFLDELGMTIESDFLPALFIPFHVAQKIANEVRLCSHVTRSGTIEVLENLGYEVEDGTTHEFHERNLSSNYREFSAREIARLTVKVFGEIANGVTVSSGPTTEAVVVIRPLPCAIPVVVGETIGLEVDSPSEKLKVSFGDCQC